MKLRRRTRRRLTFAGIGVALLGALVIVGAWVFAAAAPAQRPVSDKIAQAYEAGKTLAPAPPPKEVVRAAFLGDSYTAGAGTSAASKSFASVAARSLQWQAQAYAKGGTGYTGVVQADTYMGRVGALIADKPNLVVVSGSRNDGGAGTAVIEGKANELYAHIKASLPGVKLVVVGPMWVDSNVPENINALNAGIRNAAAANGATFIDALAPSWLDGSPGTISEDGVHPTEAGHKILAEKFTAAVKAAGL